MTEEQMAAFLKQIADQQKAQFEAMTKMVLDQQKAEFARRDAQSEAKTAAEQAKTAAEQAKNAETQEGGQEGGNAGTGQSDAERIFQAKLRQYEAKLEAAQKAQKDAEEKRQKDRLHMDVQSAIAKHFPSEVVGNVMAKLQVTDRISYTKDGNPGLKFNRNGYDEILPIEAAMIEFSDTDEGKTFLPARGISGTGDSIRTAEQPLPLTDNKQVDWDALKKHIHGRNVVIGE